MRDVMDYAMNDYKTEKQFYVSGINCFPEFAREEMQLVKEKYGKTGGILAFHGYQSFAEGEVAADVAHKIGVELAEKLWPDYQVIVATHLNTHCYHNHFVLNSVSCKHGGKFNSCKEKNRLMRFASDKLCMEYGLSVIKEHEVYFPKHYAEWVAVKKGQPTWRSAIREDFDKAIMMSVSFPAFMRNLQSMGYVVDSTRKHFRVRPKEKERFVRVDSLGENYTVEAIKRRVLQQQHSTHPQEPEPKKIVRVRIQGDFHLSKVSFKGLRALFFYYLRKLREAQRQPRGYAPYFLRDELRTMNAVSEQAKFLHKHNIETPQQLEAFKHSAEEQISQLLSERNELTNKKRHIRIEPERLADIDKRLPEIAHALKSLRKDLRLCDDVADRSEKIVRIQEQLKQQEMEVHEQAQKKNKNGRQFKTK